MGIKAPAEVKFALIYEAVKHDDNMLSISYMCEIAGVSREKVFPHNLRDNPGFCVKSLRSLQDDI